MKRPKTLSPSFVKAVSEPSRYGDGRGSHGLSLLVKKTANGRLSKTWSQKLKVNGAYRWIGLGSYPVVSLAQARQKALENKQAIVAGRDPRNTIPTLAECVERVIAIHLAGWRDGGKSEQQWRSSLGTYVYPRIGDKPINQVSTADLLAVLTPVWNERPETARRIKQRLGKVMKWAVAESYRESDPTTALAAALPKHNGVRQHHRTLPYANLGTALDTIRTSGAYITTKLAIEFLALTACRSGEVRLARWDEIDVETATWTIPGTRMKTGREHRVPLSPRALEILEQAGTVADSSGLIFPSVRGKELSDNTLSKLFRELGIKCVPHGLRSSFRDWAAECSSAPREIAELCLAHIEGSAAELAYRRTDYFEIRRQLMNDWAAYVMSNNVIPLQASA